MKPWWIAKIVKMVVFVVVAAAALGLIVMLLWNALIPELFKGPELTFWQALGLLVLSHILLRGWGRWRYANGWRHDRWRKKFEAKLAAMTPDEREKFREEWQHRCGHGWEEHAGKPSESKAS
jgi:hypothetical protein